MHAVNPITIELFGVPRDLRATPGARKMLIDEHGPNIVQDLLLNSDLIAPILYALMHDAEGIPPADITIKKLQWGLPVSDTNELIAIILSAFTNGTKKKEEFQSQLTELQEKNGEVMKAAFLSRLTGSNSSASTLKPSDSNQPTSGGDISNANSTPDETPTGSKKTGDAEATPSSRVPSRRKSAMRNAVPQHSTTSPPETSSISAT